MTSLISRTSPYAAIALGLAAVFAFVNLAPAEQQSRSRIRNVAAVQPTRIEVDNQNHQIRFYVAGKLVNSLNSLSASN